LQDQANSGDVFAAMEQLRERSAATPAIPPGIARVRVSSPKIQACPALPRRLCDVDPQLAETFAALCAGQRPWPMFLYGDVGTGKTLAALSFLDVAHGSRYATLESACDDNMAGRAWWREERDDERTMPFSNVPEIPEGFHTPIVLDELGERSKVGDLAYTTLKGILDWREFHHSRVAIYISNLAPSALAELFDSRIVSRLTCGTVYKLAGKDRRHG
jgi:hypothetical protein